MRRTLVYLLLVVGVLEVKSQENQRDNTLHLQHMQVSTFNYVGNIQGAPAYARVSFEQLYNYVVMAGQIRSGQFLYSFRVDLVGYSGFGEMVSHVEGTSFQIKIDLTPTGFNLTANPFGPGTPTTYTFTRSEESGRR